MASERDREIWDDATNAVCQAMQEHHMCNCPDGDCLAAKIDFSPEKIATATRPAPAATDTGLETVEHQYWHTQTYEWLPTGFPDRYRKDGFLVRELVTRSQAEELLAAERAETERLADDYQAIREQLHRGWQECCALKAENAAKDARIKELEHENNCWIKSAIKQQKRSKALEAKLTATEKSKDAMRKAAVDYCWQRYKGRDPLNLKNPAVFTSHEWEKLGEAMDAAASAVLEGKPYKCEWQQRAETAETKLAAAEKALEFYADISKYHAPFTGGFGELYYDCGEKARAVLGGENTAAEQAGPVPAINAKFETSENGITGIRFVDVKRVEYEDDGSLTVVIDYWPEPARAVLGGKPS